MAVMETSSVTETKIQFLLYLIGNSDVPHRHASMIQNSCDTYTVILGIPFTSYCISSIGRDLIPVVYSLLPQLVNKENQILFFKGIFLFQFRK